MIVGLLVLGVLLLVASVIFVLGGHVAAAVGTLVVGAGCLYFFDRAARKDGFK